MVPSKTQGRLTEREKNTGYQNAKLSPQSQKQTRALVAHTSAEQKQRAADQKQINLKTHKHEGPCLRGIKLILATTWKKAKSENKL